MFRQSWRFVLTSVVLALTARFCFADAYDPPTHYYDAATDSGFNLRSNLHNIITAGYVGRSYGDSRYNMGTFEADTITPKASIDQDPNNPNNILLIYNRVSIPGKWDNGITWNREHTWPKFWLDVTSSQVSNTYIGPASDAFELRPSNPSINSARSDSPYGFYPNTTGSGVGGVYGNNAGTGGTYWFPGIPDAGETARTMFYMATRYFNPANPSRGTDIQNLELKNGLSTKFNMGDLNSFINWHYQYTVDTFERRRNQMIYGSSGDLTDHALNPHYYQANRNPYIDHPEWVWSVFVNQTNDSQIAISGASVDGNGGSAKNVDLGRVFVGDSVPEAQSVTLNKGGLNGTYYSVATTGAATSTLSGPFNAFRNGQTDSKSFNVGLSTNTTTAGLRSGSVTVDNLDITTGGGAGHGANDANDTLSVSLTVLDHATPSFNGASAVDSLSYDFGDVNQGSADPTFNFDLFNFGTNPAFTAGLDFDSFTPTGDSSVLTTDLAGSAGSLSLAGGLSHAFTAMLDTASAGMFSATYTLMVSDENIAGALNKSLTLTLTANVTAPGGLAGDYNGDGIVDAADYTVWRDTLGQTVTAHSGADGDGDGMITEQDYQTWIDNFGNHSPGAGAGARATSAVPEPCGLFLISLGAAVMLIYSRIG